MNNDLDIAHLKQIVADWGKTSIRTCCWTGQASHQTTIADILEKLILDDDDNIYKYSDTDDDFDPCNGINHDEHDNDHDDYLDNLDFGLDNSRWSCLTPTCLDLDSGIVMTLALFHTKGFSFSPTHRSFMVVSGLFSSSSSLTSAFSKLSSSSYNLDSLASSAWFSSHSIMGGTYWLARSSKKSSSLEFPVVSSRGAGISLFLVLHIFIFFGLR